MSCFMLNMSTNSLSKLLFCFWMDKIAITFLFSSLGFIPKLCNAADIITSTQSIKDGDIIVSSGGRFALGFFSPGTSQNRYVGIWYNNIPGKTVVWVANRESPVVTNTSGRLVVVTPGILVLLNDTNTTIWSSNTSTSTSLNPIAQLLDNGNFVVRDENDDKAGNFLWQSFDNLTDTLLPGMKLGRDFVTGLERYLSSWKSDDDPAPGDYTYHCDPTGYPQNTLKKGPVIQYRTGPWNGLTFSGTQNLRQNPIYRFYLVFNEKEVYYGYEMNNPSIISRLTLNHSRVVHRWTWIDRTKGWQIYLTAPTDHCDTHSLCGAYGRCNVDKNPECGCLDKFVPKYQTEWDGADWSNGCRRRTPLDCKSDGFLNYSGIKLPDSQYTWYNKSMTLEECKKECSSNCSCVAYANLNISNGAGSGCLLWVNDLLDIRQYFGGGQDIYVRMASSDLDISVPLPSSHKDKGKVVKVLVPLLLGIALVGLTLTLYVWRKKKNSVLNREEAPLGQEPEESYPNESQSEELELPAFGFSALANATKNFSINCKIGEGGFGSVYKGLLEDGQEIAVKRLSMTSIQGLDEFKNEVICISKLQHRNLVKLLGCCIQGEEKMLIYEYMPNKSLDYFLFDEKQSNLLDWPKRFNIINGIARGLLYLHQDSRLRIIHRDLKASNILLDFDMNPKISDFDIARRFGGNQTEANTQRVVGTYGYMSPEYAVDGVFSVKSDVFSFGVLVLETVSGKKNRGFSHQDHQHNLLGHAWILQKEGRSLELIDATLYGTCYLSDVLRSIHVGLLCVQQSPEDRPSMSSVVLMLSGERGLPLPKQPGFFTERNIFGADFTSSTKAQSSSNEVTITLLEAR